MPARPLEIVHPSPSPDADELLRAVGELRSTVDRRFAQLDGYLARLLRSLDGSDDEGRRADPGTGPEPVAVYCLGAFRLVVDGAPVDGWRSSKALSLFQYLVTRRQQLVSRETLIQALWDDPNALAAGTSLKVAVHALRQALRGEIGRSAALGVVTSGAGYRLEAARLWVDVDEFERSYALGRGREAEGDTPGALACFSAAAALYRGDFLPDVPDDWAIYRREALRDEYLYVLGRLAHAAADAGDFQEAMDRCQQILAHDPCHEDTYRLLMDCHARLGQRGRVRSWYELCVRRLRAELDCAPEPETERAYRLALAGRA
ncbi:MAG TPA: BTAD domain-containing putative transcriptional regulator [Chloroflexota bacterium]|jgi:DNA-binding SARP family transcriptional activator